MGGGGGGCVVEGGGVGVLLGGGLTLPRSPSSAVMTSSLSMRLQMALSPMAAMFLCEGRRGRGSGSWV
jgi:hypothetical protein